jgi:hypothetical protein
LLSQSSTKKMKLLDMFFIGMVVFFTIYFIVN